MNSAFKDRNHRQMGVSEVTVDTLKKCWVVLTQFWVKYGQTQPLGYIFKLSNYIFSTQCSNSSIFDPKLR